MNNWIATPLEQLADISSGGTPSRIIDDFWGGDIPWVTPSDITKCNTNYLYDTRDFITWKGLSSSSAKLLPAGTLLFTSRATIGEVRIATKQISTNQGFKNFIAKDYIDADFLFYQVIKLKNEFVKYAAGSTFLEINRKDTGRILIPHPVDRSVQRKISHILKTIDRTITHTEALIEKYQQIKAGLMHDLFTRGIGADGKLRPPRDQAPEMYRESSIGWIPKEWEVKSIISFADVIDPNPSHRNPIYHDEGFPFISTVEFEFFDEIRLDTSRRVIEEIVLEQERRCKFSTSSIVFSRKGTIGETRFLPSHLRFALLDSLCVINPQCISPSLLFHLLRSHFLKRQTKNMTMGQALPQMSIGRVRDLLIPAPVSVDEQKEIESKLNDIYKFIYVNGKDLQKLKSKKSGLMHDLLTGKVQVNIDSAEAVND